MKKELILTKIIEALTEDLRILTEAAKAAHAAATHEECVPDNKYDTTGLEASYVAQGQANRAQEIRRSLESYRLLALRTFDDESPIRLTALVTIEAEGGLVREVFLGPAAGGLKLRDGDKECTVITPSSPLGRALLGKVCDDEFIAGDVADQKLFTVLAIS